MKPLGAAVTLLGLLTFPLIGGAQISVFFDHNEQPIRIERDTNGDGRADQWEHLFEGKPARIEQDRDFDGEVDLWQFFEGDH